MDSRELQNNSPVGTRTGGSQKNSRYSCKMYQALMSFISGIIKYIKYPLSQELYLYFVSSYSFVVVCKCKIFTRTVVNKKIELKTGAVIRSQL